jgi:DNA polymerase III subunit epsilon
MDTELNYTQIAKHWVALNPLFLDTETTGLGPGTGICEVAIIDLAGNVVFQSLIKPACAIGPKAESIHGISNDMVAAAPTIADVWPRLCQVLKERHVVIYNADFDVPMLYQSARIAGADLPDLGFEPHCAMRLFADYYGEWDDYHGNNRWQSLGKAINILGIQQDDTLHRAQADADACRKVLLAMAESKAKEQ